MCADPETVPKISPEAEEERLSSKYHFERPNDRRALSLMNDAALATLRALPDIKFGYGFSDEYR